jgi:hypothetical protein
MTIDEMKRANALVTDIEYTERLIEAFHKADEIAVGTDRRGPGQFVHEIVMTPAEIGDQIVAILEDRVTAMRAELKELGVD